MEDPSSTGVVAGAVIGSLLALLLVVALIGVLLTRSRRQRSRGYPSSGDSIATGSGGSNGGDYGNKARLLFSGNSSSKNGTGANNNGPIYTYREGCDATGTLTEKANDFHHHHLHHPSLGEAPSAHDILLSGDMDEAERRKFDLDESLEEEEERYERFGGGGGSMLPPAYHVRRGHAGDGEMDVYLDDDMESQKDGSVISRTAIYV